MVSIPINSDINTIRRTLENSDNESYIEINLEGASIPWMSSKILKEIGYGENHLKVMSIYEMVPNEFHENLSNIIADSVNGHNHRYGLWPFKCTDSSISWFYTIREDIDKNQYIDKGVFWYKISLLSRTNGNGQGYVNMMMTMNIVNLQNEIKSKLDDNEIRNRRDLELLQETDKRLESGLSEIRQKFAYATSAMEKAATAAIRASSDVNSLRNEFHEGMSKQTAEIIRLISMDSKHDELIKEFNSKIVKAAEVAVEKAVEEISQKSKDASTEIVIRAGNAGKNLAKKVTFPVSLIAVVMTIIQFVLSNWDKFF